MKEPKVCSYCGTEIVGASIVIQGPRGALLGPLHPGCDGWEFEVTAGSDNGASFAASEQDYAYVPYHLCPDED
jgi:hypothetical protein